MDDDTPTAKAPTEPAPRSSFYPRTHWSIVFTAGKGNSREAREAFGELYLAYRQPLLAYLHRLGQSREDANDFLHGFFEHLLENTGLSTVEKIGRFRVWLRQSLKNFVRDEWGKKHAQKRGGGQIHVTIGPDFEAGEVDPLDLRLSPEQAYDRKWAISLLNRVLTRLRGEYAQAGKRLLFAELKDFLPGGHTASSHREIAGRLKMETNTVAVNIKRLRERYAELLRAEISATTDPELVEDEWRHLQMAIGGRPETASGCSKA